MLSLTPADIGPLCDALDAPDARLCVVAAQAALDGCEDLTVESI